MKTIDDKMGTCIRCMQIDIGICDYKIRPMQLWTWIIIMGEKYS